MEFKDYYKILKVNFYATETQIKFCYRSLVRLNHPDVNKSEGALERLKEINEAYEILSNKLERENIIKYG